MKAGMLWFDNNPKISLRDKVIKAADYYRHKYGQVPNLCFVHPSMMGEKPIEELGTLTIRPYRVVLPGHLWLGIEDKS